MGKVIFEHHFSDQNLLYVSQSDFEGGKYIDIRKFYIDRKSEEVKPTKKGITLNLGQFYILFEGLCNEMKNINEYFSFKSEEFDEYNFVHDRHLLGRKFQFIYKNGEQILEIDKKFSEGFSEEQLDIIKNFLVITKRTLADFFEESDDIECFLDSINSKLNVFKK
ncbi:transcriptional coactivator p15/PC4 family protein [Myroides phaeus]|uniref:transcriptional coactivator p15/PC4 family protein n=1 Tax=Myroides phaeus TaxID=702745 RepID=UPI002DB8EB55|nr:transcriptional coactivator p15/PC4 family protein [Myroides phaeus]MEC4117131.1 transcriptional coactivator p15/PC4 family protein [Myroides phaeus]